MSDAISAQTQPVIRADLNAKSQHFSGLAAWKSIQIDLSDLKDNEWFEHVLVHESAHVFQSTESNRKLRERSNSVRFFIEGSAEYLSYTVLGATPQRKLDWEMASIAVENQKIRFGDIVNDAAFSERFDKNLFYTLGDLWTHALVEVCGLPVIGNIYRHFAKDEINPNLSGIRLWEVVLQSVRCEISDVNARWRKETKERAKAAGNYHYPQFGSVAIASDHSGDIVAIDITLENPRPDTDDWPGRFNIRIKRETSLTAEPDYEFSGRVMRDGAAQSVRFSLPKQNIPSPGFKYQLGYHRPNTFTTLYGKWRSGRTVR